MAYILGGITLPKPKKLTRRIQETAVEHLMMFGLTRKRVTNRKEQFVLEYQYLTQAQVDSLLSLFTLEQVLVFEVTETNLAISATDVLMDMPEREYPRSGGLYRQDMKVILTEVI